MHFYPSVDCKKLLTLAYCFLQLAIYLVSTAVVEVEKNKMIDDTTISLYYRLIQLFMV